MIWAPVSSWSCFCWLYRASTFLAVKNVNSLMLVLTIWWCPCVVSSPALLEEGVCYDRVLSWQNSVSLSPTSFCTSRPNLPVTPDIYLLSNFSFQSLIMKRPERLSQNCVWVPPVDVQGSSGLLQGQGLWVQQTWVWHKPSWGRSPLTPP